MSSSTSASSGSCSAAGDREQPARARRSAPPGPPGRARSPRRRAAGSPAGAQSRRRASSGRTGWRATGHAVPVGQAQVQSARAFCGSRSTAVRYGPVCRARAMARSAVTVVSKGPRPWPMRWSGSSWRFFLAPSSRAKTCRRPVDGSAWLAVRARRDSGEGLLQRGLVTGPARRAAGTGAAVGGTGRCHGRRCGDG